MEESSYSLHEANSLLGVGTAAFMGLVHDGAIRTVEVDGETRVPAGSLLDFLDLLDEARKLI